MKLTIPVRAVVVDDDRQLCRTIRNWLSEESYDAATFTRPQEALAHAARGECEIALVDLRLPEASGPEVIADLRAAAPTMRIVAMTAFPETQDLIQAVRAGASDVLEKPIARQNLLDAMQRQLSAIGIGVRNEREFNQQLGNRLRHVRLSANRTLSDVAGASGITAAQLSQIELGKTATSTWTLARICGALRHPMDKLFNGQHARS